MKTHAFEIFETNIDGKIEKTYRIWADGTAEGFSERRAIVNGFGPLLDYAVGLLIQSVLTAESLQNKSLPISMRNGLLHVGTPNAAATASACGEK